MFPWTFASQYQKGHLNRVVVYKLVFNYTATDVRSILIDEFLKVFKT